MDKYRDEATLFVQTAFAMLTDYNAAPDAYGDQRVFLTDPYALRLNSKGELSLVRVIEKENTHFQDKVLAHSYTDKFSQIIFVGALLTIYLKCLQEDEGGE